jgi:hypothetical protein
MTDADKRFHEQWIGMAQPSEGLVVSVPVLVDAQCAEKLPREAHLRFLECLDEGPDGKLRVSDLERLFSTVLDLGPERFDTGEALPKDLSLYVVEGKQLLRPTRALKWNKPRQDAPTAADSTPAAQAGRPYAMLVWEISPEVELLDKPEKVTGAWEYPAQAKFERLLRECRVPIGLLSNGHEIRLVYAPHGESSGWISFRTADMASVSGRPIFDAFVMLLSRQRWFGVAAEQQLPAILAESRKRNADVTTELSRQVFEALEVLLAGFAAAEERDGTGALRDALACSRCSCASCSCSTARTGGSCRPRTRSLRATTASSGSSTRSRPILGNTPTRCTGASGRIRGSSVFSGRFSSALRTAIW